MAKTMLTIAACVGAGASLSACASAQTSQSASAGGAQGTVRVASAGAAMVRTTVGETYNGLGGAMRAPFRDFNLMQEAVPVALRQAKGAVYDTTGLTSCEAVAEQIEALDLALGPDLDTPQIEYVRTRSQRLASAAADGAVSAAKSALDHYIPVRGVIRQVTGARKYEKEASRANLAGAVRRGFLKAIGMQQNCGWPAAPIGFKPHPVQPSVQLAANTAAPPPATSAVLTSAVKAAPAAAVTAAPAPSLAAPSPSAPAPAATQVALLSPVVRVSTAPAPPSAPASMSTATPSAVSPSPAVVATARTAGEAPSAAAGPAAPPAPAPPVITLAASPAQAEPLTLVADHVRSPVSSSSALGFSGNQGSPSPGLH